MDYYKILGIERNATEQDIKKAYRKLAMQYHPDRNPGDESAAEKFKQVQIAYDKIIDLNKKVRYNAQKAKPKRKSAFKVNDFKSDMQISDAPPPAYDIWGKRITPESNWKDSFAGRYENSGSPDVR